MTSPLLPVLRHAVALSFLGVSLGACSVDDRTLGSDGAGGASGQIDDDHTVIPDECVAATPLSTQKHVRALSSDGSSFVWAVDLVDSPDHGLWIGGFAAGAAKQLTGDTRALTSVRLEPTQVLWTDDRGLWSIPRAGGAAVHLAGGTGASVVGDDERIYWLDDSEARTFVRGQDGHEAVKLPLVGRVLARSGEHLYVASKTSVSRLPVADLGAAPEVVLEGRPAIQAMLVDGDRLHVLEGTSSTLGQVVSVPTSGGAPTVLASGLSIGTRSNLVRSGEHLYVPGLLSLWQVPIEGGAARQRACPGGDVAIVAEGAIVWTHTVGSGVWSVKP